ncbi:MAG TPA: hypothetical protein VEK07_01885 [Polyangiaceae bacterium]|nr:hypothetical protein [Polyangiaceae bacterium]
MTDAPLYLVHHHPGYVRMRADAFVGAAEGSEILFAARRAAEAVPGLRSWSHNPKTGSVVAEYDPEKLEADDLLNAVAKGGGFRGLEADTRTKANRKELVNAFLDGIQGLNGIVSQMTDEKADLRELVPIALVATSVISFIMNDNRGRLPQWANSLYHAYRIFMHWHRREVRTRVRAEREKEVSDA